MATDGDGKPAGDGDGKPAGDGNTSGGSTVVADIDDRVSALESKTDGIDSKLDQVLAALKPGDGKPGDGKPADGGPAGKSIADQVRDGIDKLEREKAAKAKADADAARAADHETRLKKLEETPPAEPATLRQRMQRVMYGAEPGSRPAGKAGKR